MCCPFAAGSTTQLAGAVHADLAGGPGDLIASACNIYAGSWMESAGPSQARAGGSGLVQGLGGLSGQGGGRVDDWRLGGQPDGARVRARGACRRDEQPPGRVCVRSAHPHLRGRPGCSDSGATRCKCHPPAQLPARALHGRPRDESGPPVGPDSALRGRECGSTNAGAVDPLAELSSLCRKHGVWLHADAAYGGFAALTARGRGQLTGMELADSITLDPHKWLYQPYECGCLLVKDGGVLRSAFEVTPDYLRDACIEGAETNFCDLGLQLTRTSRALKIWVSLQLFGLDAFRAAIDRSLDLAAAACRRVEASDRLELMAPSSLGVVCLRRRFDDVSNPIRGRPAKRMSRPRSRARGLCRRVIHSARWALRDPPVRARPHHRVGAHRAHAELP